MGRFFQFLYEITEPKKIVGQSKIHFSSPTEALELRSKVVVLVFFLLCFWLFLSLLSFSFAFFFGSVRNFHIFLKMSPSLHLKRKKFREEWIRNALKQIEENLSITGEPNYWQISKQFGVPKSTLCNRFNKGKIVHGRIFTPKEEEYIVEYIKEQQQGNPLTKHTLIEMINEYLQASIYF